jgi:trans-aconitate 3-methyltransferase
MATPPPADPTFRHYTSTQARTYAAGRAPYPEALISAGLSTHRAVQGSFKTLLDVGCGPGIATRQLAPHFAHAYGLDPSASMISTALSLGGTTASGGEIVYDVCSAEEIDVRMGELGVETGSVDLIVAATAAHWFDLPRFYAAAARVLSPGGSVVIFCCAGSFVDSKRTANGDEVEAVLNHFERVQMKEWQLVGNDVCGGLYVDLPLPGRDEEGGSPWDLEGMVRLIWNEQNDGLDGGRPSSLERNYTVQQLREAIGTASMVSRWREAHKVALDAGEVRDCVDELIEKVQEVLHRPAAAGLSSGILFCRLKAGLISIRKLKNA